MDNREEIKKLIDITQNEKIKQQLKLLITNMDRVNTVITCNDCGCNYKYHSKSKHLKTKKHIECVKSGKPYVAITSNFLKRKEELDNDTYQRKKNYHKERYRKLKEKERLSYLP